MGEIANVPLRMREGDPIRLGTPVATCDCKEPNQECGTAGVVTLLCKEGDAEILTATALAFYWGMLCGKRRSLAGSDC